MGAPWEDQVDFIRCRRRARSANSSRSETHANIQEYLKQRCHLRAAPPIGCEVGSVRDNVPVLCCVPAF